MLTHDTVADARNPGQCRDRNLDRNHDLNHVRNPGPNHGRRRRPRTTLAAAVDMAAVTAIVERKPMIRLLVLLITQLANVLFLLQTFVPFLKRQWFWDAQHELHFSVCWAWLGFEFWKDDVVVKYNAEMHRRCAEAMANGEYQTLESVIAELKTKSRKPNS